MTSVTVKKGHVLCDRTTQYCVQTIFGEGSFGIVALCKTLSTKKSVAIKIMTDHDEAKKEVRALEIISELDPDRYNLVRWHTSFVDKGLSCIVFETLQKTLQEYMCTTKGLMSLNMIRPIVHQLAMALRGLKRIGLMYTDLKEDNIMLVNQKKQPYKVKLIDFGFAISPSEVTKITRLQALAYKCPEVLLVLPITYALDIWALGCLTARMYMGFHLFMGRCEYDVISSLVGILGEPSERLLDAGLFTKFYFKKDPKWRLKTREEYFVDIGINPVDWPEGLSVGCTLDELLENRSFDTKAEEENKDRKVFADLLNKMLTLDGQERITAKGILQHPFLTMIHLKEDAHSRYAKAAVKAMVVCSHVGQDQSTKKNRKSWFSRHWNAFRALFQRQNNHSEDGKEQGDSQST